MPIMLTRKDGPPTPFRNAEYIPFYYFIPKSMATKGIRTIKKNGWLMSRLRQLYKEFTVFALQEKALNRSQGFFRRRRC